MKTSEPLAGTLCQIEFAVSDIKAATEYYSDVLGWLPVPIDLHGCQPLAVPGPFGVALIQSRQTETSRTSPTTVYFSTKDGASCAERYKSRTGKTPSTRQLPGYGKAWILIDPDGNQVGVFQAGDPAKRSFEGNPS
jgi:predicted enzyme related to lactoylglutathione lyase